MKPSRARLAAAAAVLAVAAISPLQAATLNPGTGTVSISRAGGTGFEAVTGPTSVAPGDTVIVGDGGSAQIAFENGAIESVSPGQIYSVPTVPPPPAALPGSTPPPPPAPAAAGAFTPTTLAVGAAVGAAGIGAAVVATQQDKPRSP